MTPREIVRRCIEFKDPPRIGLHFQVMPIQGKTWDVTDFAFVGYSEIPGAQTGEGMNEWGYHRESFDVTGEDMGQVKEHPLGEGWEALESYQFPDFSDPRRYCHLSDEVAGQQAKGKYVYGHIPSLMTLPGELRGLENWFMDHVLYPGELCHLLDMLLTARLHIIEAYANAGVDGVIAWDDMGTNERPMISPAMFSELYLPRYRRTCDALHERGMHFIHHCCGQVREYVPLFVEAGCDVLQLDQPNLMGIDWLAENFGGRVCFWNPVDIQRTIGRGDLAAIAEEAHHQIWALGRHHGGFMVKAYQQPNSIGMSVEESQAQYDAFLKFAKYPLEPYSPLS